MNRALATAASGMAAQQINLEIIADNLANADVAGFKASAATFADLGAPGARRMGTAYSGSHPILEQGKLMKSGGPFDVALDGPGFFELQGPNGARGFTRAGEFTRAADGSLRNAAGWALAGVRIPAKALSASVETDGRLFVDTPSAKHVAAGRIRVAHFASPEGLQPLGTTVFAATAAAGPPGALRCGDGSTKVVFGMLERSNVSIVESMMHILSAQRAYEANAKGVQAADEMLRIVNNIHRG